MVYCVNISREFKSLVIKKKKSYFNWFSKKKKKKKNFLNWHHKNKLSNIKNIPPPPPLAWTVE